MSTEPQSNIAELLERAGARSRGKRFDCPDCGARGAVSVNESKQLFCCHHFGCEFHGGVGTLQRRLGIERERLPRAEYLQRRKTHQRACAAALSLYSKAHQRQLELREQLRELGRAELVAHEAGPVTADWDSLARVYRERPEVEQELDVLENGSAKDIRTAIFAETVDRKGGDEWLK